MVSLRRTRDGQVAAQEAKLSSALESLRQASSNQDLLAKMTEVLFVAKSFDCIFLTIKQAMEILNELESTYREFAQNGSEEADAYVAGANKVSPPFGSCYVIPKEA